MAEVVALHAFFDAWFVGSVPDTDEVYARFADAMASDFVIVSPDGRLRRGQEVTDSLRSGHGAHDASDPRAALRIRIENASGRLVGTDMVLVTYEEWHDEGGASRGRQSTAVLRADAGAPGGWRWLVVHETWLPQD